MGTKLYVGNLPFSIDERGLRELFETEGLTVSEAAIVSDRETGRPRGFGFVTLANEADAKSGIAKIDGKSIEGRTLRVNEATAKPTGRPGGFGGGGGDRGSDRGGYDDRRRGRERY